jgi:hypothetical protein
MLVSPLGIEAVKLKLEAVQALLSALVTVTVCTVDPPAATV